MAYLLSAAIERIRVDLNLSSDATTTSLIRNTFWWAISVLMLSEETAPEDMIGLYNSFEKTVLPATPLINLKTDSLSVDFMRLISVRKKSSALNMTTLEELPISLRSKWNTNDDTIPLYTVYWYQEGQLLKFVISQELVNVNVEVLYIKNPPVSISDSTDLLNYFSYGLVNKAIDASEKRLIELRNAI